MSRAEITTPEVLAEESVVYTHAYSVSSYTAKSVAAFMASRYDFSGTAMAGVTMTRGKPIMLGPVARLAAGMTFDHQAKARSGKAPGAGLPRRQEKRETGRKSRERAREPRPRTLFASAFQATPGR